MRHVIAALGTLALLACGAQSDGTDVVSEIVIEEEEKVDVAAPAELGETEAVEVDEVEIEVEP